MPEEFGIHFEGNDPYVAGGDDPGRQTLAARRGKLSALRAVVKHLADQTRWDEGVPAIEIRLGENVMAFGSRPIAGTGLEHIAEALRAGGVDVGPSFSDVMRELGWNREDVSRLFGACGGSGFNRGRLFQRLNLETAVLIVR